MYVLGALFGMTMFQMAGGFISFFIGAIISFIIFYKIDKKVLRAVKYLFLKFVLVFTFSLFLTFACFGCNDGDVLEVALKSSIISEIVFILLFWLIYKLNK